MTLVVFLKILEIIQGGPNIIENCSFNVVAATFNIFGGF